VHAAKSGISPSLLVDASEASPSFPSSTSSIYAACAHGVCEEVLGLLDFLNPRLGWDWLKGFFLNCPVRGTRGRCPYVEGCCPYVEGACWRGFSGHSRAMCPKASQQKHFPCSLNHCLSALVEARQI
jgi:hypothetical protein